MSEGMNKLRIKINELRNANMFLKADIAEEVLEQAWLVLSDQQRRIADLEKQLAGVCRG